MNRRDAHDLLRLVGRFIAAADRTPHPAADIEGIVIECCQDEEWFDEVSGALALFVPGGGEHYLDEVDLASELALIVPYLRRVAGHLGPNENLESPGWGDQ